MKVKLIKQVHSCLASICSSDIMLEKIIDMPFPPFAGLEISDGDFNETIECVVWNCEQSEMRCYTEEDKELYYNAGQRPVEEVAAKHTANGWELRK